MALEAILLLVIFWYVSCSGGKILGRVEDLELEQDLQHLTKPAVETVQTIYGDTYDCVEFYQQPAFDDPIIKNHSIHLQMKPTFYGEEMSENFTSNFRPERLCINGKSCPIGTVPIRRITKEDLIRAKRAAKLYASNLNPETGERPGVHFAVLHTPRLGVEVKYYGAGMRIELCNPKLNDNSQYSSSQVKIQNGRDSIIFGWTVHPNVYNDSKTRFFIYTYANNKHCFNHNCGVFVHTNKEIPLDMVFDPVSPFCATAFMEDFFVHKDVNGNWGLQLSGSEIGYWPSKFFTGLADFATYIEWGGEVYSPTKISSPEMGNGISTTYQRGRYSAACANLRLVNEDKKIIPAMSLVKYEDINKYYQVVDEGYRGSKLQHVMAYGGKGGYVGN